MSSHLIGNKHRAGKVPWDKGLKGVQITSPETRKKLSEIRKKNPVSHWKGKAFSVEHRKAMSEASTGKTRSLESIQKTSGERHYNWKGGICRNRHGNSKNVHWRKTVYERDDYTCQECGERGCYLEAHHIKSWAKYPELRYELSNGTTLCKECHKKTDTYFWKARTI